MATVAAQAAQAWPFCWEKLGSDRHFFLRSGPATLSATKNIGLTPISPEDYKSARRTAFAIVLGQLGISLVAGGLCWLVAGPRPGYSALLGGGIGTLASLYMAVSFFRAGAAQDPRRVLWGVYVGELVKLVTTAMLFIVVIMFLPVAFLPLFAGYLATFLIYWLALLKASPRS